MKHFFAWIADRGIERKPKIVVALEPQREPDAWVREFTTIELGELQGLYTALGTVIAANPKVFYPTGELRPVRGRTTIVIEHDVNKPFNGLTLANGERVVKRHTDSDPPLLDDRSEQSYWEEFNSR